MKKPATLLLVIVVLALSGLAALLVFHPKPKVHTVQLNWRAPAAMPTASGLRYNIYRGTSTGGPYAKIASELKELTYRDGLVNSGRTYFYVVTTVDANGRESRYSSEATAAIP